jgi:hypothetical protein
MGAPTKLAGWQIAKPWAVALGPEFDGDRNGRWTGNERFVKAVDRHARIQRSLRLDEHPCGVGIPVGRIDRRERRIFQRGRCGAWCAGSDRFPHLLIVALL